jgi:hypothetical protein
MLSLIGAPVSGAVRPLGPIEASIAREAARQAAQPPQPITDAGWAAVTNVEPGTRILVTITGIGSIPRRLVSSDGTGIVVTSDIDTANQTAERVLRADIVEIKLPAENQRSSVIGAAAAAGLSFALIAMPLAIGLGTEVECQPNCGGVKALIGLALVGIPLGAGYVTYKAIGRRPERTIYRAP